MPNILEELAVKGGDNLYRKLDVMKTNYKRSKEKAIKKYEELPFGPTRRKNYRNAWKNMPENYSRNMDKDAVEKWKKEWKKGIYEWILEVVSGT